MSAIDRDPKAAAARDYDAVIVGGGIHGCMALLHAGLAGRRVLLVERADFGGQTSFNSLRIVHGGLRYLQSLDLVRFMESVAERRWLLRVFPDLVRPLPCLMPLYDRGMKRGSVMRVALALNDLLSAHRDRDVRADRWLPRGKVISAERVREICPFVRTEGLAGGAVWYDACIPDSHRVVMEVLRWAAASGGTALNYVEATALMLESGRVTGVEAHDRAAKATYRFRAPIVINAGGPWCNEVLRNFGQSERVAEFSLAWNVLFNGAAGTDHAVALTPAGAGAHTYFLHPWKGRLLIGTGHRPWSGDRTNARVAPELLQEFIADLDSAAPALKVAKRGVGRVFSGLLPSIAAGSAELTKRPEIVDHGAQGGVKGLYSMIGIKFTTARRTALRMLRLCGLAKASDFLDTEPPAGAADRSALRVSAQDDLTAGELEVLASLAASEAVCNIEDLAYRRLGLYVDPAATQAALEVLEDALQVSSTTELGRET